MQREVNFYSGEQRIAANLHLPDGGLGPFPGVVLCTGFGGVKDLILPSMADVFVAGGMAVLRFDHRGFGASEGTKWRLLPLEQVEDIRSAISFISAQPEVDAARIGLYGTSFGGGNAIVAAANDPRPRVVVTCVAVGDGPRWMQALRRNWEWIAFQEKVRTASTHRVLTGQDTWVRSDEIMPPDPESHAWHIRVIEDFPERKYELPLATAEAILEFRPVTMVDKISPRPVLFIAVENDYLVPTEQTRRLFELAGEPKGLLILEDVTHHGVYSGEPFQKVMTAATDWFHRYL